MKKIIGTLCLLTMSSTAFAASIKCNVNPLLADKAGYLMPVAKMTPLKTEIQDAKNLKFEKCTPAKIEGLSVTLCAVDSEFVGGYDVALFSTAGAVEETAVSSTSLLATLKNGKGLIVVNGVDNVLESFLSKTRAAGINSPTELTGDSLALDEAVKQGMEKGVLTPNEPVVLSLQDCSLEK